jgi:alpha-beta hydrolase superfamily lysophospholipase
LRTITAHKWRLAAGGLLLVLISGLAYSVRRLPALGAGGLLHPVRRHVAVPPPAPCQNVSFAGLDVTLAGWRCHPSGIRLGALVYLHGIADNRASAAGMVERFVQRGFEVLAYDSRAHGDSGGDACTYGYFETQDLSRVLDSIAPGPVVLVGTSLGAAVSLQSAARDRRITAVVAAETFSDLRTVVSERAPLFFTRHAITRGLELAEQQGRFDVDAVSPLESARTITAPVLLIHGAADTDTSPDHSRRVFDALRAPKQLRLVQGAGHNASLGRDEIWREIERWVADAIAR